MEPELLVMFCPYCGSQNVHGLDMQNPKPDTELIFCVSCDEVCIVTRSPEDDPRGDE